MKYFNKIVFCFGIVGMFLFSTSVNAQVLGGMRLKDTDDGPKGQFMIYGSFDYSKTNSPSGSSSSLGTSSNAGVPIGVGYFINNNDVIGVNYAFAKDAVNDRMVYKQNEAGVWYSPSLSLGKYFALIGQVDAHYVWGKKSSDVSASMQNFNGYRLRAYPLFAVFLGGGWALKFKFAELSMLQTKVKGEGWTRDYVAGISGSTFGGGISKNFNFKKRSDN
ncbi:hypothetical protein LZQ00_16160 [Sphingobacterium sp. SRCM116780]|uniref:hypothetical protein n=1 Tax=Sphingobacterium sp. SRCM116780 TaxID=2907623 RepID=UPI001F38C8CF|nr:hypothetical protein [Sphingobacterium sp. SRCM116780]UIR55787.1 hypothetical protein LZQ00_16160 [Sphingobacterium sp. SRCM116780]